jgi:hypothetical protein
LIYLFISKAPRKERPFMFLKSGTSIKAVAHSRASLNVFFKILSKGALSPGPPYGVLLEKVLLSYRPPSFIIHSPRYTRPPPDFRLP